MANVFISSTGLDLKDYRTAAIEICNRLSIVPIAMEFFEAMGKGASSGSLKKLQMCDVYVGIFAHRYGYIENEKTKSVTEIEFDAAADLGLDRLCFILKSDYPWPATAIDNEHKEQLEKFKQKVNESVIRNEFTTIDDFKAKLLQALNEWLSRYPVVSVLEALLDIFETRRAFFKGDEQAINHILEMMNYLDAGRTLAVAYSLAEVIKEMQAALLQIASRVHTKLKQSVSKLIVACKDYVECYGIQPSEYLLPLPHIGRNQRIEDFTLEDERYNFPSLDSFEVFNRFINYIKESYKDLLQVRINAVIVIDNIISTEGSFKDRALTIRSEILSGQKYLESCIGDIEKTEQIITEITSKVSDFKERKTLAANIYKNEASFIVSSLLNALSKIRNPTAWSKRNSANTLKSIDIVTDEKLKITFLDGFTGEFEFEKDLWNEMFGKMMDSNNFKFAQLNSDANLISWGRPFVMEGESLRAIG